MCNIYARCNAGLKQIHKMKNIIALLFISIFAFTSVNAQQPTLLPIVKYCNQGEYVDYGGVNLIPRDSLLVSDTAQYIIPINHTNEVFPYLHWYWYKIGSGTATLTVNFYQSNDPTNFITLKKGKALTAYTKSYTLSASGWNDISFKNDTVSFEGRYLKVEYITSSTASVKGKLFNRLKINYR